MVADTSRFRLDGEIARGGAGVVFAAYDKQLDCKVAVKFLSTKALQRSSARKRFLREAQVLTRLDHPNIVTVHEVGGDDAPYIVMDFVPGGSLDDRLEADGTLPQREAAHVACQLALAIQHAHDLAIVHRDIKPGNVLLRHDGEPLVTDFGLAKNIAPDPDEEDSNLTSRGRSVGTPGFWAPEQATGEVAQIGPATDVYGIGGTLYAMLVGQPPHTGKNLLQIFESMKAGPRSPRTLRAEIDAELERICLKCLTPAPDRRYQTAQALASDLERYLNAAEEEVDGDTIRSGCPVCGRTLVVPSSMDGHRGRCPGCKRVLRIRPGTAVVSLQLESSSQPNNPVVRQAVAASLGPALGLGLVTGLVAGASAAVAGGSALAVAVSGLVMWVVASMSLIGLQRLREPKPVRQTAPKYDTIKTESTELLETIKTQGGLLETIKTQTKIPLPPDERASKGSKAGLKVRPRQPDPNA